jgi:hypothetical protein
MQTLEVELGQQQKMCQVKSIVYIATATGRKS